MCHVQVLFPTAFPATAPLVATFNSVAAPLVARTRKSVRASKRVPGIIAHNQGPVIFRPPVGNPGLPTIRTNVFSDKLSKGEKSDIALLRRSNRSKLLNLLSDETSDITLFSRYKTSNLVNSESGDTSDIRLASRFRIVKFFRLLNGDKSVIPLFTNSNHSNCVNSDSAEMSEIVQP